MLHAGSSTTMPFKWAAEGPAEGSYSLSTSSWSKADLVLVREYYAVRALQSLPGQTRASHELGWPIRDTQDRQNDVWPRWDA